MSDEQIIKSIYQSFNARDIDAVFFHLSDDVAWANGMEKTHVHGKAAVRAYWTHQWSVINPRVVPLKIEKAPDGTLLVQVHQLVKDLTGAVILDEKVTHCFSLTSGRVSRFDIQSESKLSAVKY